MDASTRPRKGATLRSRGDQLWWWGGMKSEPREDSRADEEMKGRGWSRFRQRGVDAPRTVAGGDWARGDEVGDWLVPLG